jgi:small subunit ribosomal protein S16
MVSIRLSRSGAKKRPFYHLVVTDSRNRRDGRYIERLGFFNPLAKGNDEGLRIDLARVQYWIGRGAQPSDRVASLLKANETGKVGRDRKRKKAVPSSEGKPAGSAEVAADIAEAVVEKPEIVVEAQQEHPQDGEEAESAKDHQAAEAADVVKAEDVAAATDEKPEEAAGATDLEAVQTAATDEIPEEEAIADSEKK